MKQQLNDKQEGIKNRLGIRKTAKLIRLINSIRNSICNDCRTKFDQAKAQLDLEDYCDDCKDKAAKKLKSIEGLTK